MAEDFTPVPNHPPPLWSTYKARLAEQNVLHIPGDVIQGKFLSKLEEARHKQVADSKVVHGLTKDQAIVTITKTRPRNSQEGKYSEDHHDGKGGIAAPGVGVTS